MDLNKLKVNDLKAELASRNLDIKGVKAILVERLREAIEKENDGGTAESLPVTVKKIDLNPPSQSTPLRRSRRRSMTRSPSPVETKVQTLDSVCEIVEHEEFTDPHDPSDAHKKRRTNSITKSPSPVNSGFKQAPAKPDDLLEVTKTSVYATEDSFESTETTQHEVTTVNPPLAASKPPAENKTPFVASEDVQARLGAQNVSCEQIDDDIERKELQEDVQLEEYPGMSKASDAVVSAPSESEKEASKDTEHKVSTVSLEQITAAEEIAEQTADSSLHIKDETSMPKKVSRNKAALVPIDFVAEEQEPDIDEQHFSLSWYDSHLNLEIDPEMLDSAKPISEGVFALVWAGARANLGVTQGKVVYEVLLSKYNETRQVTDEPVTSAFRVGWSTKSTSLELGEVPCSFAYDGNGYKGTDNKFIEYGIPFKVNDVVGVYLDLDSSPCRVEFTVNGACQGVAFEFEKKTLLGQALFPHVYSRNIAFKVNFGQFKQSMLNSKEQPGTAAVETNAAVKLTGTDSDQATLVEAEATAERQPVQKLQTIQQDFIYIASSAKENLEHGPNKPASRKDCEVIFLIGLPASGKSFWLQNYLKKHSEKRYTILSVDSLLNQMKVQGKAREPSNTNKWAKLVEHLSKDLSKLNEIAGKRRRNFILDQTNVFLSEQRRRLRVFGEYAARKAVVVVPSEEEYNRRFKLKQDTFGIEIPEGRINIMKANFFIPTLEQEWFTEMEFAELDEENTHECVRKLNEFGRMAHPRGNSYRNQQQNWRGCGPQNQRWHQGYGNNRYQYQQGDYRAQRYNKLQQYCQNQNFRPGNGYGRHDSGHRGGTRYGYNDWTHNNSGRYGNRSANQGYRNNQTRRYDGNRGDNRGYNSGSIWNQQNSSCWSYGSQNNDTQQWYSWWQSNLKNLLQQHGSDGSDNSQQNNVATHWSQYAHQQDYGNYQQSKSHGSGPSSKNK